MALPTHILRVKERDGEGRCAVGVGWLNADGSVTLQLNPCVVLSSNDNVYLTLFPADPDQPDTSRRTFGPRKPSRKGKTSWSALVIPADQSNGHSFVEIHRAREALSIQCCSYCDARCAVEVPLKDFKVDPCSNVEKVDGP